VPCEFFFVIKLQFEATPELKRTIILNKINLMIKDKSRNRQTGEIQTINVKIERDLKDENDKESENGLVIRQGGPVREHNILLYVEYLKATVNGHVEYIVEGEDKNDIKTLEIKEFELDLLQD
jgi:hypothetical protein